MRRVWLPLAIASVAACRGERRCVDVLDVAACYDEGRLVASLARRLPDERAPEAGWRCEGSGAARRCVDRARAAGSFVCAGDSCEQRYPRLPDDGQWECADLDGAVVCRGGGAAAGVDPGAPDLGWSCGTRTGAPAERICVDLAPDLPRGETRGWRCRSLHTHGERRVCERAPVSPPLGARCGAVGCAMGSRCLDGRCLPERLAPACWLDADCGTGGACRAGSCVRR